MIDLLDYGARLMREEAQRLSKIEPIQAAPPTGKTPREIRAELAATHPDIWLLVQHLDLPREVLEAMCHLMGRVNVIQPENFTQDGEVLS